MSRGILLFTRSQMSAINYGKSIDNRDISIIIGDACSEADHS